MCNNYCAHTFSPLVYHFLKQKKGYSADPKKADLKI